MPKIIENLAERLLEEAKTLLLEKGYEGLNMRAVAQQTGVGLGTVYNYYASKDNLIAGILLQDWNQALAKLKEQAKANVGGSILTRSIYDELIAFIERYGEMFKSAAKNGVTVRGEYHAMLRSQLADLLKSVCRDEFATVFIAEALLTWTVEAVPYSQLEPLLNRIVDPVDHKEE